MKRNLLLILVFSLIAQFSFAQLMFSETEFNETLPLDTEVELIFNVTNSSTEAMTIKWERTENFPNDDWYSFMCDKQQCFIPSVSDNQFNVDPNEVLEFKVTISASTNELGSVSFSIYDVNDPSNSGNVVFNVNDTSNNDYINVENVKVYPNPASDYIKLSNADGIATMEVFNIIGKKVKNFTDVQTDQAYNVSDLPKGMYMVRLLDDEGEALGTKRISIR